MAEEVTGSGEPHGSPRMPRRYPASLYGHGAEPDPRFSLANERTFLAWIRTSLALIAAGVALEAFVVNMPAGIRLAAALLLVIAGIAAPVQAWFGWLRIERALRNSRPLPAPTLSLPIVIVVVVAGILVLVGLLPWS
jgi:putative membrane protein